MNLVYLCLGGNLGDTKNIFCKAINLIENKIGRCVAQSHLYKTEPWGFKTDKFFLNQVISIETPFEPLKALELCLQIEAELGRTRSGYGYEPRIIDIDILFVDNQIINLSDLKVPHPLIQERNFVLQPMSEIAPDFVHPVLRKTIAQLCAECGDTTSVERLISTNQNHRLNIAL